MSKDAARPDAKIRPAPLFLADSLALDFLNSIAAPAGETIEWLANGEDILAWLEQAKIVPPDAAAALRANAFPGELDAVAARARALREWFRTFVLAHKGASITPEALEELAPLNDVLEWDEAYFSIGVRADHPSGHASGRASASGLEQRLRRRWRTPASLLAPIAEAMAQLVCSADFSLVKKCQGPTCTLVMLDTTRGPARRWCSMALCGNRAKQAAHRDRAKRKPA